MRRLAILAASLAALACTDPTAPMAALDGTWALVTIDGQPLPVTRADGVRIDSAWFAVDGRRGHLTSDARVWLTTAGGPQAVAPFLTAQADGQLCHGGCGTWRTPVRVVAGVATFPVRGLPAPADGAPSGVTVWRRVSGARPR